MVISVKIVGLDSVPNGITIYREMLSTSNQFDVNNNWNSCQDFSEINVFIVFFTSISFKIWHHTLYVY